MAAESIVALVGGETLLGSDVRELIADRLPQVRTRLIGAQADHTVILTQEGGEPAVITALDNERLASAQAVVLAGSADSSRKAMAMLRGSPIPVFDLTYGLEDLPEARLAPESARVQLVPHPAASTLIALLRTLHPRHTVERCVAQILVPASEYGRAGVDELQKQTTQLLTFQPVTKAVFPEQLALNLLAGTLGEAELRIEKHVASLLARTPEVPMPSLRLIQAPVMHGYSFSIWVQLGMRDGVAETLKEGGFEPWPDEAPNVMGVAGQTGMSVGALQADRNDHHGFWIWIVADQFRVASSQCVSLLGAAL